jgi:hypothetical protein
MENFINNYELDLETGTEDYFCELTSVGTDTVNQSDFNELTLGSDYESAAWHQDWADYYQEQAEWYADYEDYHTADYYADQAATEQANADYYAD